MRGLLSWLDSAGLDSADPLADAHGRDFAVRDYKTHLKTVRNQSAHTVNAHITALDHFFGHLGLGAVLMRRDEPPSAHAVR
ncbi:hypothetical protein [Nocardia sp. NPDC047038]|uniref:hypothetical protein n=1 Tax=Nocardia sp. NPDC047038 TaxID=3154338 RepID=UPI00340DC5E0